MMLPKVLTVSGFDPSAGAGMLADIKVFQSSRVYGFGAMTALTTQNESTFKDILWIPMTVLKSQLDILFEQHDIVAVKIGITQDQGTFCYLVDYFRKKGRDIIIVWDPVLRSSSGFDFWKKVEGNKLKNALDHLDLITPNLEEYVRIWGRKPLEEIQPKAALLVKSCFKNEVWVYDRIQWGEKVYEFKSKNMVGYDKHGTGCVISSAMTAGMARGLNVIDAYRAAKKLFDKFLISSPTLLGLLS